MDTLATAKKALDRAKIGLMASPNSAFITTVCFSMKHIWDETITTANTDGLNIRFNPNFFMALDRDEQLFLLQHEAWHVALLHMVRLNGRKPEKWNIAADYVINDLLVKNGFKMPQGGKHDPQYRDMSTEQVYDLLPDDPQQEQAFDMDLVQAEGPGKPEDGPGGGSGGSGAPTPEELEHQIADILVRASIQSKMAGDKPGSIPGDVEIFLDGYLNPKLPWDKILRKYMNSMCKDDYTWRRPNRRYFPDHYLPTMYSEGLMDIAEAIDASGSVSDDDFHRYVSETRQIIKKFKPKKLTLIQFDAQLKSVDELHSVGDLKKVNFTGRGGTWIKPVIDWAIENKPQLLLIFSDGYFNHVPQDPGIPIIWIIHNNPKFTAPYGKVIHFEM